MPYKIDETLPAKLIAKAARFSNLLAYRGEGKGPNSPTSRRGRNVFSVPIGVVTPIGAVIETAFKERGFAEADAAKSDIRYAQGGSNGGGVVIALLRRNAKTGELVIANEDGIPTPNVSLLEAAGRNPSGTSDERTFVYNDVFFEAGSEVAEAITAAFYPPSEKEAAEAKAAAKAAKAAAKK